MRRNDEKATVKNQTGRVQNYQGIVICQSVVTLDGRAAVPSTQVSTAYVPTHIMSREHVYSEG